MRAFAAEIPCLMQNSKSPAQNFLSLGRAEHPLHRGPGDTTDYSLLSSLSLGSSSPILVLSRPLDLRSQPAASARGLQHYYTPLTRVDLIKSEPSGFFTHLMMVVLKLLV